MNRLSIRLIDWPMADTAMWIELTTKAGPLDPRGALSHLREPSRGNLLKSYGRWLGWLKTNRPDALEEPPAKRATPERINAWIESISTLRPDTRLSLLEKAMRVLQSYNPERDWSAHRRLASLLRHELKASPSNRKRGRIVASDILFHKGLTLIENLNSGSFPNTLKEAQQRRDGMMVAFLALLPIRRRSFCELEFGRSLFLSADRLNISLNTTMTKNRMVWEADVPSKLAGPLLTYIQEVRPWFLDRAKIQHNSLWINDSGRAYCAAHLGTRISRITEKLVGVRVNPHLFRDCAATTLAYDSPDSARLIRAILGHSTFRTAERHYNQARAIEAGRDYVNILDNIRGKHP